MGAAQERLHLHRTSAQPDCILSCWNTVSNFQPGLLGLLGNNNTIKHLRIPTALVVVWEDREMALAEAI